MNAKYVAIELQSDRIDIVRFEGGSPRQVKRIPITLNTDPGEWAKEVRRSAPILRAAVDELGIEGWSTRVLYRSPTQAADLVSVPVRSNAQAIEAATMGCIDSLPYSTNESVCEAIVIGRDQISEGKQTHVVVTADRNDIAAAIVEMVEHSGLSFTSATPIDAALLGAIARSSIGKLKQPQGLLYLGVHSSLFLIVGEGKLFFSRRIGLGLDSLVRGLTRPIRSTKNSDAIELDLDVARSIFHKHGIPDRDTVVDEQLNLTGYQLIPLLQPILQRFIVELRQSIRFGLSDDQRDQLQIQLCGPGGHLPGLTGIIGEELNLDVTVDPDCPISDWTEPGVEGGELCEAVSQVNLLDQLNLLPSDLSHQRRMGNLRRWLWTGAAAALIVIAIDATRYQVRLNDVRQQAEAQAAQSVELDALRTTGEQLRQSIGAMNELERIISQEMGSGMAFNASLHELSRLVPESIRFTSIRFYKESENTRGIISGYAFLNSAETSHAELERFMEKLHGSPLFEQVSLGTVQLGSIGEETGQRFEVTFTGAALPYEGFQNSLAQVTPVGKE